MRGFGAGILWGGVVAVLGLGVVSLLAPIPPAGQKPVTAANEATAPVVAPKPEAPAAAAPKPAAEEPEAKKPAVVAPVAPAAKPPAAATPKSPVAEPEVKKPAVVAPVTPAAKPAAPVPAPVAPATAPAALPGPAAPTPTPAPAAAAEPATPPTPAAPAQPEAGADSAPAPDASTAPLPGEVPAHSPLAPVPGGDQSEALPVEPVAPAEPLLDRPEPGLNGIKVEGVTTNRLPRIEAPADPATAAAIADPRPVTRFAARFDNPQNKPRFAILLIDDGKAQIDRTALAALQLPVTIVLDPATAEGAKLEAIYRKAGKEVAMLATQIPKGAAPSDLAVTFAAHARALPQAVAVVDLPEGGFQNSRQIAADLVPVVKDQGRGLVTFDKGLNAGDQVARREAVPAALIFRELDGQGEDGAAMRRHLDRAAFKAAQDGRVAVLGHATPDTIAALLEWSVEGRAGSVALAPLTAVLAMPE